MFWVLHGDAQIHLQIKKKKENKEKSNYSCLEDISNVF